MTTTASVLDPKFAKIIALMNSTEHDGERQSCRACAEAVAKSCGMSFDEAMLFMMRPVAPSSASPFEGFADWMERREPGYKARDAAERTAKDRARLLRRMAILERYGNKDAALAPCAREKKLRAAVAAWMKPCKRPHQRWTDSVDGFRTLYIDKLPDRVRNAIATAYRLPTTFQQAKSEYDYWLGRRRELEDVLGPEGYGDSGLDLIPEIRMDMVRDLAERELPVTTLIDLHARFAMYRDSEVNDERIEEALFRDLGAMVEAQETPPAKSYQDGKVCERGHKPTQDGYVQEVADKMAQVAPVYDGASQRDPSTSDHDVADMLRADATRSDRHIARACGCSPTTVGKIRRQLGLVQAARLVQRRGQTYRMKVVDRQAVTP